MWHTNSNLDALPVGQALVFLVKIVEQIAVPVHDFLRRMRGLVRAMACFSSGTCQIVCLALRL